MTPRADPSLSDLERTLLLVLLHNRGSGYGAELRAVLAERTGRQLSPGALYTALARMENKGLVRSWVGEPTAERGGRRKRHYAVEAAGEAALRRHLDELRSLTADLPSRYRLS